MTNEPKASDEEIYQGMVRRSLSKAEVAEVSKLIFAWSKVTDTSVKIVFFACVNLIQTMGPAYCRIAVSTLSEHTKGDQS